MNDLIRIVRDALVRAVQTLKALPGGSIGPVFPANSIAARVVREWSEYGSEEEQLRFQPTPHDVSVYLEVLAWLTWYEHHVDERHAQVFWAWALDKPVRTIRRRFNVSSRTIHNWLHEVPERIVKKFETEISRLGFDKLHELREIDAIPCKAEVSVSDVPLARSPAFVRHHGAKPDAQAARIEGSRAHRERARTIRKLEKNARKWRRLERARQK